ncbi:MAG: hypothetical protein ACM3ZE_12660, partial [Myxococcales bacterium]
DTMNQILSKAEFHIELATTYGIPQPTVRVALPKGTPYRYLKATLHALAVELELATPAGESWCVEIAPVGDVTGTIVIELIQGTPAEAARAMALLQQVASAQ